MKRSATRGKQTCSSRRLGRGEGPQPRAPLLRRTTLLPSRVGTGACAPAPLTEPDLWATHPALQVDISCGHRPGPRLDHWAAKPVVTLTFAIRSRMTLSSGTHALPALPLPCGLSVNTTVSWHGRILGFVLPGTLTQTRPACIGVHLRSVPRFASGFHPTRPHGKDECDRWVEWIHLVQLPPARGCLRQAP